MNHLLYLVLIILCFSCQGQKNKRDIKESDTDYTLMEEKIKQDSNKNFLEQYLIKYIDSLNDAVSEAELPHFLNDSQFDYRNKGAWESFHNPISVRAQIIDRVSNCKPLQLIIISKNKNFKKKPIIENDLRLPCGEQSFYDIAMKRIETLGCK